MKKLYLSLILLAFCMMTNAQMTEKTYYFTNPVFTEINGYELIHFEGCTQSAEPGQPSLPWQTVSLLLPQNTESQSIEFIFGDFVTIDGEHEIYPYQPARPLLKEKEIPFIINEAAYHSRDMYPSVYQSDVNTRYLNGCSIALSGFTPVRYIPESKQVSYAKSVTVKVTAEASKSDRSKKLWLTPENIQSIKHLAQNPEIIDSYKSYSRSISGYELLVITSEEFVPNFTDYQAFYQSRGLRTEIVSLEEIFSQMGGIDDPEKIRNYIIQEYENNGIQMVMLGGDVDIMPYRSLYCYVNDDTYDTIPADLYYAALDGTWNENGNELWGEVGEDDLFPEIAVARMPFNNVEEFQNIWHKIQMYHENPVPGEFRTPLLCAEWLSDDYCASVDMNAIIGECNDHGYYTKGVPANYDFIKLYADEDMWSGENMAAAINNGVQFVHHDGHAGTDYVAGWYTNTVTDEAFYGADGVNHNYTFFFTHGCTCGDFPNASVLEKMVQISKFCVTSIGNSRYGWYIPHGDGPSRHMHRELTDALFTDRLHHIGLAFKEMKIMTAPTITVNGEYAAMRWNFYDINILGDVAACPWLDEPFTPQVTYPQALAVGTTQIPFKVMKDGEAQSNFRISLYQENELLGVAFTDEGGAAVIDLESPAEMNSGDYTLIVNGLDAWVQDFAIQAIPEGTAQVAALEVNIDDGEANNNGRADYGETIFLDLDIQNFGTVNSGSIAINLSTESNEYFVINDGVEEIFGLEGLERQTLAKAFSITLREDVPDLTNIPFTISCNTENQIVNREFFIVANAPRLIINTMRLEDSDNDGVLTEGETATLHITSKNIGHSPAPSTVFKVSTESNDIDFEQDTFEYNTVECGESYDTDFEFTVGNDFVQGERFYLDLLTYSTEYQANELFRITLGNITEDWETGDFSKFLWDNCQADKCWEISEGDAHEGNYSAKAGNIGNNKIASLSISFTNNYTDTVSFYIKTSTEQGKDFVAFYIDNAFKQWWSGETEWERASYEVAPGEHKIEWRYDTNNNGSAGSDCVMVDDIIFPTQCEVLDIEENTTSKIAIVPNPNDGNFSLILPDSLNNIKIFNMAGQIIYNVECQDDTQNISLPKLNKGLYLVVIENNGNVITNKMIIK